MLHVGPHARVAFAVCWIVGQAALVFTAPRRPDASFGFHMFPEASLIEIHLARETAKGVVPVSGGTWQAPDRAGHVHEFYWRERVRDPILSSLDARVFASYGVDAQLARLQRALDDVADHTSDDAQTLRLVARVVVSKNGHEPSTLVLTSHRRPVG